MTELIKKFENRQEKAKKKDIETKYGKYLEEAISKIPESGSKKKKRKPIIPISSYSQKLLFKLPFLEKLQEWLDKIFSGEIIIITYFVNPNETLAKVFPNVIDGVKRGEQILNAPFEIWDGYSRFQNFSIGVSIYESDSPVENAVLIPIIRGILELDINDQFNSGDNTGVNLMNIEKTFEEKFNELMEAFGYNNFIPIHLEPVEKFREWFEWNDLQGDIANPVIRTLELENAKIKLQGYGYNDKYSRYFKKVDGSGIYLTNKNNEYYEEILKNATGQYETDSNPTDPNTLIESDNGNYITCGVHYNWFHFDLLEVTIKKRYS